MTPRDGRYKINPRKPMKSARNPKALAALASMPKRQAKTFKELQSTALILLIAISGLATIIGYILANILPGVFGALGALPIIAGIILILLPTLKGSHSFVRNEKQSNMATSCGFTEYSCKHCGETTALDGWQLASMPGDMAFCPNGQKMSIFMTAAFPGSIDCRG